MFHLRRSRRRSAVLWGAAFFLCGQLAICLVLICRPPPRDPEYDVRLQSLRARMTERPAQQPVLFLGSSRVACTFRSALLPVNHADSDGPVVFNFAVCNSGPVMELLCLRRLIADGVKPKCIFVEVWPAIVAKDAIAQMANFQPERLQWRDAAILRRLTSDPRYEFMRCLEAQLTLGLTYRSHTLNQWAPYLFPLTKTPNTAVDGLDGWGWLNVPVMKATDAAARSVRVKDAGQGYIAAGDSFAASEDSLRSYKELFALCRRNNISLGLVAMPDDFLPDYSSAGRSRMDAFLCSLSQNNQLAMIDARTWSSPEDYFDGVHLTHDGAAVFTERFGRDVLAPFLKGEPLTYRWPPGRLNTVPSAPMQTASAQSIQK